VDQNRRCWQDAVRHDARREAMKLLGLPLRPDFGSQQPQTHLHQPVVEVTQHDVVAPCGDRMIKYDRTYRPGVGMGETFRAQGPTARQCRHMERAGPACWTELRLSREDEPCFNDVLDIGRG